MMDGWMDGWMDAAQRWAVMRQGALEGGFAGRTNKLVDGCYSFWVGGVFPLLCRLLPPLQVAALRDTIQVRSMPQFPAASPPVRSAAPRQSSV
jgi:prenyltransferase beta subunit